MDRALRPAQRIRDGGDFRRLLRKGRRWRGGLFLLYFHPNEYGFHRIAVTTSRASGGAVCRNKIRRVLREAFRCQRPLLQEGKGVDFWVLCRDPVAQQDLAPMREELLRMLRRMEKS